MKVDAQYTPQHTDFGFGCREFWVSYISWSSEIFALLILNLVVQISGCLKFGDLYFSGFAFWRSRIWDCTILDGLHFSHCQFWIWICRLMAVYNLGFYNFGGSTFLDLVVQISGGLESGRLHFSGVQICRATDFGFGCPHVWPSRNRGSTNPRGRHVSDYRTCIGRIAQRAKARLGSFCSRVMQQ